LDPIDLVAEHKLNRFFRARKKLTQSNVISHITQRAAGKDPCFVEDDDFLCMLGFLKESAQKHDYEIFSFCLMGNHAHLLLRPNQGNLQSAMRDLFSRYAMRFNRKYKRRGHLFGGPYQQAVCLNEAYLIAASIYIHLNDEAVAQYGKRNPGSGRSFAARLYGSIRSGWYCWMVPRPI